MNNARNTASVMLSAGNALLNSGTLVIYSGTMPATPQTALSGNTALATFTFSATAFGTPAWNSGTSRMEATASFAATSVTPSATGTASFARTLKSDGTTVVNDLTVGTSGTDLVINSVSINTAIPVAVSALVSGLPAS